MRLHLSSRRIIHDAHINTLASARLVAVHGNKVLSIPEGGLGGLPHPNQLITGSESRRSAGERAVDVYLHVLIVIDLKLKVRDVAGRQIELAPHPDVVRPPLGP